MPLAIGIFGGTFDPVHYGHLRAADEVRAHFDLDEMRLLPAGDPPHRAPPGAPAAHRLAMLELALAEFPALSIDAREIARSGKSYTVLTLEALRAEHPAASLALVVGADAFLGLPSWHRWRELFDLAHVVVVTRPGTPLTGLAPALEVAWTARQSNDVRSLETAPAGAIFDVAVTPQPISATAIRALLSRRPTAKAQLAGLLPAAVLTYIDQHALYRSPPDAS